MKRYPCGTAPCLAGLAQFLTCVTICNTLIVNTHSSYLIAPDKFDVSKTVPSVRSTLVCASMSKNDDFVFDKVTKECRVGFVHYYTEEDEDNGVLTYIKPGKRFNTM